MMYHIAIVAAVAAGLVIGSVIDWLINRNKPSLV